MVVPLLLIAYAIRLKEKTVPLWDYIAISLPNKNSPRQICWALSSNNLPAEEVSRSIYGRHSGRLKKSLVVEVSEFPIW